MRFIGNLIWAVTVGWICAVLWIAVGLVWCITIVGIPVGSQCFKLASLSLVPFGKEIVYGGGAVSFLLNVIWFLGGGGVIAAVHAVLGVIICITIIGIPFGKQLLKIARLALSPFGCYALEA